MPEVGKVKSSGETRWTPYKAPASKSKGPHANFKSGKLNEKIDLRDAIKGPIKTLPVDIILNVLDQLDTEYLRDYGTFDAYEEVRKTLQDFRLTCKIFKVYADPLVTKLFGLDNRSVALIPSPSGLSKAAEQIKNQKDSTKQLIINTFPLSHHGAVKKYVEDRDFARDLHNHIIGPAAISHLLIKITTPPDLPAQGFKDTELQGLCQYDPRLWCTIIESVIEAAKGANKPLSSIKMANRDPLLRHYAYFPARWIQSTIQTTRLDSLRTLYLRGITEPHPASGTAFGESLRFFRHINITAPNLQRLIYTGNGSLFLRLTARVTLPPTLTHFEIAHCGLHLRFMMAVLRACPPTLRSLCVRSVWLYTHLNRTNSKMYEDGWQQVFGVWGTHMWATSAGTKVWVRGLNYWKGKESSEVVTKRVVEYARGKGWDFEINKVDWSEEEIDVNWSV